MPFTLFVQTIPEIGSPFLTVLAAVPVDAPVLPVIAVRYWVPAGQLPFVFCGVYVSVTVVVPLPFFHVIFSVRVPANLLTGTVTFDDAPALNAAGVHALHVELVVPFEPEIVVVEANFEHKTLGVTAPAETASGTTRPAPAATATASAPVRIENFTETLPLVRMSFSSQQKIVTSHLPV